MHVVSIFIAPQLYLNIWEHFDVVFEWSMVTQFLYIKLLLFCRLLYFMNPSESVQLNLLLSISSKIFHSHIKNE